MPPHMHKKKSLNDKFYTKPEIVDLCIECLKKHVSFDVDFFVEPSAGSGNFFDKLPPNKIGYDIEPENILVIKQDWFTVDISEICVVVGNPPFGVRNLLTNEFIRHAMKFAKCIAFVLPAVYMKESMQKVFSQDWSLVENVVLERNSFTLNGLDYHVPCVFQIWKNKKYYEVDFDLRETAKIKKTTDHFSFDKNGEYFIFGAAPNKIINSENISPNNRGYKISCNNQVVSFMSSIDWKEHGYSSVNGGVSWFGKQQLIDVYLETLEKQNYEYE